MKNNGLDSKIIPKNLAANLAIIFGEENYPKHKVEEWKITLIKTYL